jgi:nucleotide-binding universal stress UspA family protein
MEEKPNEHLAREAAMHDRSRVYRKILVASDGSDGALKALTTAFKLALESDAELHMLCIAEIPYFPGSIAEVEFRRERANRRLVPALEQAKKLAVWRGLSLECHLLPGHPVSTIVDFVRDRGFDLLVIGFTEHSALYNRIIGSTADWLVELAPCTVLVVK